MGRPKVLQYGEPSAILFGGKLPNPPGCFDKQVDSQALLDRVRSTSVSNVFPLYATNDPLLSFLPSGKVSRIVKWRDVILVEGTVSRTSTSKLLRARANDSDA